jgi:hypothetical protein
VQKLGLLGTFNFPIFTEFSGFFRLSWETSPQTGSTPEASKDRLINHGALKKGKRHNN